MTVNYNSGKIQYNSSTNKVQHSECPSGGVYWLQIKDITNCGLPVSDWEILNDEWIECVPAVFGDGSQYCDCSGDCGGYYWWVATFYDSDLDQMYYIGVACSNSANRRMEVTVICDWATVCGFHYISTNKSRYYQFEFDNELESGSCWDYGLSHAYYTEVGGPRCLYEDNARHYAYGGTGTLIWRPS